MSTAINCVVNQDMILDEIYPKIHLSMPLAYDNAFAHAMRITAFDHDKNPADLTGVGVVGNFKRSNGTTVTPILGTVTDNVAEILLPPSCYVVPGRFTFTMNLTQLTDPEGVDAFDATVDYEKGDLVVYDGVVWRFTADHDAGAWTGSDAVLDGITRSAMWVEGHIDKNISENIVDPGTPVGNIEQAIGNATAAATAAQSAATEASQAAAAAEQTVTNFAPAFDASVANAAGDYVTYTDGKLYLLPDGHTAGATWANTTHTETDFGAEVSDLKSAIVEQSATQPTSPNNRIWFPSATPDGVEVPTWAEHEALYNDVDGATEKSVNLLPVSGKTATFLGVTVAYSDGVVTIDGTVDGSGGRKNKLCEPFIISPGTYTFSRSINGADGVDYFLQNNSDDTYVAWISSGCSTTVTISEAVEVYIGCNLVDGKTFSQENPKYIQLQRGTEILDYQHPSYITAYDRIARQRIAEIEGQIEAVDTKINSPLSDPYGTNGQLLRSLGNGNTEWTSYGLPTDAQTASAVDSWLDAHPEATTTVLDYSLTANKLVEGALGFVTPEMYGAAGDGTTNDYTAFYNAINSGFPVYLNKTYLLSNNGPVHNGLSFVCDLPDGCALFGPGTIKFPASAHTITTAALGLNLFWVNGSYKINGITIDMNGFNNIVPNGSTHTMYALYGHVSDSDIRGLIIKNSAGRNMIHILSGNNNIFANCKFARGGTNIPGNVYQDDFSFVFASSDNTTFDACIVDGSDTPLTIGCGGIELHGSHSKVTNCTIKNVSVGVYIANNSSSGSITDIIISNNNISARNCIDFWYTGEYSHVTIDGNNLNYHIIENVSSASLAVSNTLDSSVPPVARLIISNNNINSADATTGFAIELAAVNDAVIAGNIIDTSASGVSATGDYINFSNNIINYSTTASSITATNKQVSGNLENQS